MKRLLPFAIIMVLFVGMVFNENASNQRDDASKIRTSEAVKKGRLYNDQSLLKPQYISQFAKQAEQPAVPIEDREHINWLWWVIGVILVLAGGMVLYVLIKKNPRKDVR